MKILFFSTYFYPYVSGITTSPLFALQHLAKKHAITVYTFPHNPHLPKKEFLGKIKIIRLPYLMRVSKGFIAPHLFPYFLREVQKYDCVILNSPNFEGLGLALAARMRGKKVYTLFNCKVDIKGGLTGWLLKTGLNISVYVQLALSNTILTYTQDYFDSIPTLARFEKKVKFVLPCIKQKPADKKYLKTLSSMKKRYLWIGFVGRIAREKGIEHLIAAVKKLKKNIPDIMLVLAGPSGDDVVGEKPYGDYISDLLTDAHVPFRMLGKLTDRQLGSLYEKLDVLVLPSINHTEAFGMVQVEAMFANTPVIASMLPGVRVPVATTKMGLNVNPLDEGELKRALVEVLTHKRKYASLRLSRHAKKMFDIHKAYITYDRIFKQDETKRP